MLDHQTHSLSSHLHTPFDARDFFWEEKFFKLFSQSYVKLLNEAPQVGPDSWPYLMVETLDSQQNEPLSSTEDIQQILNWLSTRGIGLAVNPQKEYPDYVFTYGMIWNFKETGLFVRPSEGSLNPGPTTFEISEGSTVQAGPPTEKFLPLYVRSVIKNFLMDQGVLNPRILVLSTDGKIFDLVFSLDSLNNPPENEHAGIAEAISWFLPPHYSIILMKEQGLAQFTDL